MTKQKLTSKYEDKFGEFDLHLKRRSKNEFCEINLQTWKRENEFYELHNTRDFDWQKYKVFTKVSSHKVETYASDFFQTSFI